MPLSQVELLQSRYPSVPWREMSDIRNKIIHNYFGIDYDIVWDTVKTDIPQLKDSIEKIIEREKQSDSGKNSALDSD